MFQPPFEVKCLVSAPFDQNCYVARQPQRQDCLVIDPGFEPDEIVEYLKQHGLRPAAILNTHGHVDHIAGNGLLKQQFSEAPLVIGRHDAAMLTDPMRNLSGLYGFPITSPPADDLLDEGQTYRSAGFELEVLEIPGHSPGHIVLVWRVAEGACLFGGDVLFRESVGRTDFPGGSFPQLADGIRRKLFTLPDATVVFPGHGPTTTVGHEKRFNPFVGEAAEDNPLV